MNESIVQIEGCYTEYQLLPYSVRSSWSPRTELFHNYKIC